MEWVISENLIRRHLTSSQRAVIAHDLLPMLRSRSEATATSRDGTRQKGTQKVVYLSENGAAASIAARVTKTNATYVQAVKSIGKEAPDLLDANRAGSLKVPDAATLSKSPRARREKVLKRLATAPPEKRIKQVIREAELDSIRNAARRGGTNGRATSSRPGTSRSGAATAFRDVERIAGQVGVGGRHVAAVQPGREVQHATRTTCPSTSISRGWKRSSRKSSRVLRDDGSFFLNVGSSRNKPWNAMRVAEVAGRHFVLQNDIVWVKAISIDGESYGHFTPLAGDRYLNHCFENVFHFTKTGKVNIDRLAVGVPTSTDCNLKRNSAPGDVDRRRRVVHSLRDRPGQQRPRHHPATFPVELAARCITLAGIRKNTVVLDPFVGIGSTLSACQELGISGIGIDMDAAYCKQARKRVGL